MMIYCHNCGKPIDESFDFCFNCGAPCKTAISASAPEEPAESTPTEFCHNCGKPIQDSFDFCFNCGAPCKTDISDSAPEESAESTPTEVPENGTTEFCHNCGKPIQDSFDFCFNCGAPCGADVTADPAPQAQPEAPAPTPLKPVAAQSLQPPSAAPQYAAQGAIANPTNNKLKLVLMICIPLIAVLLVILIIVLATSNGSSQNNNGGNTTNIVGGNTISNVSGNTGGNVSGNTGGNVSGNTGGNVSGNTGGNVSGNTGGNVSGNTGGTSASQSVGTYSHHSKLTGGTLTASAGKIDLVYKSESYLDDLTLIPEFGAYCEGDFTGSYSETSTYIAYYSSGIGKDEPCLDIAEAYISLLRSLGFSVSQTAAKDPGYLGSFSYIWECSKGSASFTVELKGTTGYTQYVIFDLSGDYLIGDLGYRAYSADTSSSFTATQSESATYDGNSQYSLSNTKSTSVITVAGCPVNAEFSINTAVYDKGFTIDTTEFKRGVTEHSYNSDKFLRFTFPDGEYVTTNVLKSHVHFDTINVEVLDVINDLAIIYFYIEANDGVQTRYYLEGITVPNEKVVAEYEGGNYDQGGSGGSINIGGGSGYTPGQNRCAVCDGDGRMDCFSCGGDGKVSCTACHGTGTYSAYGEKHDCYSCVNGTRICSACHGSGGKICTGCGGDGYY